MTKPTKILEHVDEARSHLGRSSAADSDAAVTRELRLAVAELADALVGVADHVRAHNEAE